MAAKKRGARGTPEKGREVAVAEHSDAAKARALMRFREFGTVLYACEAANIGRTTWYRWLKDDPAFAALVASATEDVTDALEQAAYARATAKEGASDTLLIFLLKARRPEKYRERQEITMVSPHVQGRLEQTVRLIGSRDTWTSADLLAHLDEVWR